MTAPADSAALPQARILGYIGHVTTPTRVRTIAARLVSCLGWLHLLFAAWMLTLIVIYVTTRAPMYTAWRGHFWVRRPLPVPAPIAAPVAPPVPGFTDYRSAFFDALRITPERFVGLLLTFPAGLLLVLLAGTVRKGQRLGSILCIGGLVPLIAFLALVAAALGGQAVIYTFGIFRAERSLVAVPWLLATAFCCLLLLLLIDLCGYLRWIARHPTAEKPPVPFLPTSQRVYLSA
jgi:hypothetical protein